jgi:nitric oxide reductase NorQ protein
MPIRQLRLDEHRIIEEPYYLPIGDEISIAEAAYYEGAPLLLKGPTGCGKTRFIQYLA